MKDRIKYTENKIAKNIGLLFRSKTYLKKCLLSLHYSYIHTHICYTNIAWRSTYISNLKKVNSQQKRAIRTIYNKKKYETVPELLKSINIFKVCQIKKRRQVYFYPNSKKLSHLYTTRFSNFNYKKPSHLYSTRFSKVNYTKSTHKLNKCKFRISVRGPYLWN